MVLVSRLLQGCEESPIGYMDDILIFSCDEKTHLGHLEIIFRKLQNAKLKIKSNKCSFFKKHQHYYEMLTKESSSSSGTHEQQQQEPAAKEPLQQYLCQRKRSRDAIQQ